MSDIKPCPFCGHTPTVILDDERNRSHDPPFWIECENHHCISTCKSEGAWSEYDAIVAAWNRRSDLCITRAEAEAMVAAERERIATNLMARSEYLLEVSKRSGSIDFQTILKGGEIELRNAAIAIRGETKL